MVLTFAREMSTEMQANLGTVTQRMSTLPFLCFFGPVEDTGQGGAVEQDAPTWL